MTMTPRRHGRGPEACVESGAEVRGGRGSDEIAHPKQIRRGNFKIEARTSRQLRI